jgi:hypothetical protein
VKTASPTFNQGAIAKIASSGAGEHREHVRDAAQFPELSAAAEHGQKSFVGTTPFPAEKVPQTVEGCRQTAWLH